MTDPGLNLTTKETVEEEARRLGVSARTVYRRRALDRRDSSAEGRGNDNPTVTVVGTRKIVSDNTDKAWEMLAETLRDTIKRQEKEIERQAQTIDRLEKLIYGVQELPATDNQPSIDIPVGLPIDLEPSSSPAQPPAISYLPVIAITFLITYAAMYFIYGHK